MGDKNNKVVNFNKNTKEEELLKAQEEFIAKYIPKPAEFKSIDFLNGVLTPDDIDQ